MQAWSTSDDQVSLCCKQELSTRSGQKLLGVSNTTTFPASTLQQPSAPKQSQRLLGARQPVPAEQDAATIVEAGEGGRARVEDGMLETRASHGDSDLRLNETIFTHGQQENAVQSHIQKGSGPGQAGSHCDSLAKYNKTCTTCCHQHKPSNSVTSHKADMVKMSWFEPQACAQLTAL